MFSTRQTVLLALIGAAIAAQVQSLVPDNKWRECYQHLNEFLNRDGSSDDPQMNMRVAIEFYNDGYRRAMISNNPELLEAHERFIALQSILGEDMTACGEKAKTIIKENIRGLGKSGQGRRVDEVVNYYITKHRQLCRKQQLVQLI